MKNRKAFSEFMTAISEMHDKTPSNLLIEIYWKSLQPFTDDQCNQAFSQAVSTCKFFPKPVELIEFITGSPNQVQQIKD